jgi:ankyrin repeat protein
MSGEKFIVKMAFEDILPIFLTMDFGDEALILFGLSRSLWNSNELLSISCNHKIGVQGETRLGRQCRINGGNPKKRIARTKRLLALPRIDLNNSASLKTPLMNACKIPDIRTVELLLAHSKLDVNMRDENGNTALMWASSMDHSGIVKAILSHRDCNPNLNTKYGATPLLAAAFWGHVDNVKALIAHPDIDIDMETFHEGLTAFHVACREGKLNVVKILASHPYLDVNRRCGAGSKAAGEENEDGDNGLAIACYKGDLAIVRFLLSHPIIDVNIKSNIGTPLMIARDNHDFNVAYLLLDHPDIDNTA